MVQAPPRIATSPQSVSSAVAGYGPQQPIGSYGVLLATYLSLVGGGAGALRLRRQPLPEQVRVGDLVLLSVAVHKLSRLITKDAVTGAVRAPFTRFVGSAGEGEVQEEVRGRGLRHAVGELLTCPFCIAQWLATALVFCYIVAPRATRLVASTLTVVFGSDILQFAYSAARAGEKRLQGD